MTNVRYYQTELFVGRAPNCIVMGIGAEQSASALECAFQMSNNRPRSVQ